MVEAPVGAEVSSIPEEAAAQTEGEVTIYQFDDLYFTEDTNGAGRTVYRVEPQPAQEEIDSIPPGSPSFVADQETYYYVDYNFYVEFEESGKKGYVNGEPARDMLALEASLDDIADRVEGKGPGDVAKIFLRMVPPNIIQAAAPCVGRSWQRHPALSPRHDPRCHRVKLRAQACREPVRR